MAYLEFKQVSKIFLDNQNQENLAVDRVEFQVNQGEFVVFVGPSGCGKSTLLRMVAGLEDITEGQIVLDGKVLNDLEVNLRDISMVFQDYALYPHMTVYDNLAFGLENQKLNKSAIQEKVLQALKLLELESLTDRLPKQLSGGQRQRVALGRSLVKNPKLFLLDEPLSNLDARLRVQTRKLISTLHKNLSATMIYVTHDQVEAMTLGDKIVVLNQGVVQQIGSPEEIYQDPNNTFVANFIGTPSMNLLHSTIRPEGTVKIAHTEISLSPEQLQACNAYIGKEVVVGVRPEEIRLVADPSGIQADIVEYLGSENLVYFDTDQGEIIVKAYHTQKMHIDTSYRLEVNPDKLYLFDRKTGQRIKS